MKPELLKVFVNPSSSFSIREDIVPHFYNRWHYHPEVELLYVKKASGTSFIGDNISNFKTGDMFLVGSGLPHYWRCDDIYFKNTPTLRASATVIHFKEDFWGNDFLNIPENKKLALLLKKAKRGIMVPNSVKKQVVQCMENMLKADSEYRLILLLTCLHTIANVTNLSLLCSEGFSPNFEEKENNRINDIYSFTLNNFKNAITIKDVAKIANMSPHSFCRYFKTKTKKNYSKFLHEIKIGHACKLLIETNQTIPQICDDSGFNNFVNFHRYFKIITGKTPNEYRKQHNG